MDTDLDIVYRDGYWHRHNYRGTKIAEVHSLLRDTYIREHKVQRDIDHRDIQLQRTKTTKMDKLQRNTLQGDRTAKEHRLQRILQKDPVYRNGQNPVYRDAQTAE
jgi:hypothetical protein